MSADVPDLTEPSDPALNGLIRALTADGTAAELAARPAALAMLAERRIGKPHRLVVLFARFGVVLAGIHRGFPFFSMI